MRKYRMHAYHFLVLALQDCSLEEEKNRMHLF